MDDHKNNRSDFDGGDQSRGSSCRWQTRFARLVRRYGVAKLARDLQVDPTAIYQWIRGAVSPRPDKAMVIVALLRPYGTLRLEDIYNHPAAAVGGECAESLRRSPRWNTRFAQLVARYGVSRLANELQVRPTTIYQWIKGSTRPRPNNAIVMVALLRSTGNLRLDDVYHHHVTVQATARLQ